ncbi:hypothetical protein EYZ11_004556 [Aspergillus tanneri]|uniref:Xylanolytic transcriptional activator regulatory domain-containing protein n=1 Tax=Aspergillus tanneri TaxID=1220188 RepID=A0A4S3JK54_9EURO|nr:hypothetical protein EYZ11_004556 [Aspergillus tanneri]
MAHLQYHTGKRPSALPNLPSSGTNRSDINHRINSMGLSGNREPYMGPQGKMAIPRLVEPGASGYGVSGKSQRRHMVNLESKISDYERALRTVGSWHGLAVEEVVRRSQTEEPSPTPPSSSKHTAITRTADYTEEDFGKDEFTRSSGYIGQSSEIYWMHMLDKEITRLSKDSQSNPNSLSSPNARHIHQPIAWFNYHFDDVEISPMEDLDMFALPSHEVAVSLFNTYFSAVHPSFPILGVSTFTDQFHSFMNNPSMKPGNKWLAVLNLTFAIASRYTYLVYGGGWGSDNSNHNAYFLRAKALSIDDQLLNTPDLQGLQVGGLASFYLMALGHINR